MSKFGAWVVQINIPYKLHYMLEIKQVENRLSSVDSRVHFKVSASLRACSHFSKHGCLGSCQCVCPCLSAPQGESSCWFAAFAPGLVLWLALGHLSFQWCDLIPTFFFFFSIWTPLISSPQAFTEFISRKNRPDVRRPEAQVIRILLHSLCFVVCHDIKCW